jgi:hypothetical protein
VTEAFEIGVSLALRDGVSDGIAAARRDMALIETAIRTSGVSLEALKRAGNQVLDQTRQARRAERAEDGIAGAVGRASGAAVPRGGGAAPALREELPARQETMVRLQEVWPAPDVGAARPGPGKPPPGGAVSVQTAPPPQGVFTPSAPGRRAPGDALAARVPAPPPGAMGSLAQAVVAPPQGVPAPVATPQAVRQVRTGTGQAGTVAPLRVQIGAQGGPVAGFGPAQRDGADWAVPTAPPGRAMPGAAQTVVGAAAAQWTGLPTGAAPASPTVSPDSKPPGADVSGTDNSRSSDTAPMQGDVFLDGVLVGRWMCRFLAKQAGRDPAGPTGFDPRRNAVLPGATIGLS